jgi:2-C-methyl-D-erythritol 2,4-cyclodiphosphate synthase
LNGHSDGDAVCHAIADALLGAAAIGDLGQHFPDTDLDLEGIGGVDLLRRAVRLVRSAGLAPASTDATVVCDAPTIAPRREEMRAALAAALDLPLDRVSVKATRPEGLGLAGGGIGCLAVAVVA